MNGLIFSIKRYAVHDGPGIRTTVFFKGCPLNCWWCHNPESQNIKTQDSVKKYTVGGIKITEPEKIGFVISAKDLMTEILKDRLFFDESGGGVTFSGGEPLMQIEFLLKVLKMCKEEDIHTCIDTSGYSSAEDLEKILPFTDLFLFDFKHLDNEKHKLYTGVSNDLILKNLKFLINKNVNLRIRFPLIPAINDCSENLDYLKKLFIKNRNLKNLDILPYHNISLHKYNSLKMNYNLRKLKEPSEEYVEMIKAEFELIVENIKIGG